MTKTVSRADVEQFTLVLEELHRRIASRKFERMFPPVDQPQIDGSIIHARKRYPKHLDFFRAGAQFRERCFMAANRCITPWTFIETPDSTVLAAEVWTSRRRDVLTWDDGCLGVAQAQAGLLVGIEPAFRLVLDNGRFFDCSRRHRVLTDAGWLSLDQIVRRSSGVRSWRAAQDYQASCDADGHLGDRPLRQIRGIDLAPPPSLGDVRGRAPLVFVLPDEAARTLRRIRACPELGRLSTLDDVRRFAGLFALFSGPSCDRPFLRQIDSIRAAARSALASAPIQRAAEFRPGRCEDDALLGLGPMECLYGSSTTTALSGAVQGVPLSASVPTRDWSVAEFLHDAGRTAIFYPLEHPALVGGRRIIAVVPLGLQPIIDAHVPVTSNYVAGGVIHHNTGKTEAGAYETTAHLTGLYPDWWQGRRFDRPIRAWAAGKTNETTRDILQDKLLGEITGGGSNKGVSGTGMVPGRLIGKITWKQGVSDLVDTVKIRHVSGGWSTLGLKSYQQGRGSFEGTAQHLIWLDEESPLDVYGECLVRTATTNGIVILTFTPLDGLSEVVISFLPADQRPAAMGE